MTNKEKVIRALRKEVQMLRDNKAWSGQRSQLAYDELEYVVDELDRLAAVERELDEIMSQLSDAENELVPLRQIVAALTSDKAVEAAEAAMDAASARDCKDGTWDTDWVREGIAAALDHAQQEAPNADN